VVERGLHAPEASAGEGGFFEARIGAIRGERTRGSNRSNNNQCREYREQP
jgi:hypothetical protein